MKLLSKFPLQLFHLIKKGLPDEWAEEHLSLLLLQKLIVIRNVSFTVSVAAYAAKIWLPDCKEPH